MDDGADGRRPATGDFCFTIVCKLTLATSWDGPREEKPIACGALPSSYYLSSMIVNPAIAATAIKQTMVHAVPSLAQFTATVARKSVAFGVPAVAANLRGFELLRGGGTSVDLDRADIRLSSLEEYCVIASIILGAVIDIYGDTPKEKADSKVDRIAQSLHAICVCLGFLAAMYCVVVFTLFGLYAKTALGLAQDAAYVDLLAATGLIRYRGFQSFLLCLVCFNTSLICNMFLNHEGKTRWILAGMSAIGTAISLQHFNFIINTATKLIFS